VKINIIPEKDRNDVRREIIGIEYLDKIQFRQDEMIYVFFVTAKYIRLLKGANR
jgi:hypothetical protein